MGSQMKVDKVKRRVMRFILTDLKKSDMGLLPFDVKDLLLI